MAELIRGAQSVMASVHSAVLLISTPPESWMAEKATSLGGVIVLPQDVTTKDLDVLRDRNLPFLIFTESDLPGPRVVLGQRDAARRMTERLLQLGHRRFAILSGYDSSLDEPKRKGVFEALRAAGIDPTQVPDVSAHGKEDEALQAAREIIQLNPRPTAVISFDDSLSCMLSFHARRNVGLQVPRDLSIVSFHDWPYLKYLEPALTTAHFDFYEAGKKAAEVLCQSALTGQPPTDFNFTPTYREGQTIGPAPAA
jgi:LacI family transcriptional regulator